MMFAQAATAGEPMGMIDYAWKIGGPIAVVCLGLIYAVIFLFKKYDAEKTARIEDARTYGKNQEEINVTVLPYIAKIVRRVERIERATADSDTPVALRSSLSRIELGEDTESKGPNK